MIAFLSSSICAEKSLICAESAVKFDDIFVLISDFIGSICSNAVRKRVRSRGRAERSATRARIRSISPTCCK